MHEIGNLHVQDFTEKSDTYVHGCHFPFFYASPCRWRWL